MIHSDLVKNFYRFIETHYNNCSPYIEYYLFSNRYLQSIGLNKAQGNNEIKFSIILKNIFTKFKPAIKKDFKKIVILDDHSLSLNDPFIDKKVLDCDDIIIYSLNPKCCTEGVENLFIRYRYCDLVSKIVGLFRKYNYKQFLECRSLKRHRFWSRILNKHKYVIEIHFTDSYLKRELIFQAKNKSIITIEHRHGLIIPSHIGYHDFFTRNFSQLHPDILSYGDNKIDVRKINFDNIFHINNISLPKVKQNKYNDLKDLLSNINKKNKIIIISQPSITKLSNQIYQEIKRNNISVMIKKHPREKATQGIEYIEKIDTENDYLFLGWYSTLLIDLMISGNKVYIFNSPIDFFSSFLPNYYILD